VLTYIVAFLKNGRVKNNACMHIAAQVKTSFKSDSSTPMYFVLRIMLRMHVIMGSVPYSDNEQLIYGGALVGTYYSRNLHSRM
jgi:hypothetical protein